MNSNYDVNIEHLCNGVIHSDTGETSTQYNKLKNYPSIMEIWTNAFGKEYSRMAQGDKKTVTKENNYIFVISCD